MRYVAAFLLFLILIFLLIRSPLSFTKVSESKAIAEFSKFERKYFIEREYSDGSGQYVIYTIFKLVNDSKVQIAELTTCGRYKMMENSIEFYLPHEFHCGMVTSFFDDWLKPKISRVEFTEDGEKLLETK